MTVHGWALLAACVGGVLVYAVAAWARSDDHSTISRAGRRMIAIVVFACLTAMLVAVNGVLMVRWISRDGPFPILPILAGLVPWLLFFARFVRSSRSPSSPDA
jgi:hypothetical protein